MWQPQLNANPSILKVTWHVSFMTSIKAKGSYTITILWKECSLMLLILIFWTQALMPVSVTTTLPSSYRILKCWLISPFFKLISLPIWDKCFYLNTLSNATFQAFFPIVRVYSSELPSMHFAAVNGRLTSRKQKLRGHGRICVQEVQSIWTVAIWLGNVGSKERQKAEVPFGRPAEDI